MYTINLNGAEVHSVVNSDAREFKDVKLFAGDNFFPPADASYKNLIWENLGKKSVRWQCLQYSILGLILGEEDDDDAIKHDEGHELKYNTEKNQRAFPVNVELRFTIRFSGNFSRRQTYSHFTKVGSRILCLH